jgi:hypothetical protein
LTENINRHSYSTRQGESRGVHQSGSRGWGGGLHYLVQWQFKLATWLRVYNYVKNKHVRAETVAYLEVVSNK